MSITSPDNVRKAIERLPVQSSAEVKRIPERAVKLNVAVLVEACDAGLRARPFDISQDKAVAFDRMAARSRISTSALPSE